MSAPVLHVLEQFNSERYGIPLSDGWRIPSSRSDDVIWNIVLGYLNSFPETNKKELERRLECLTGCQTVNENIKNSIKTCNPFLHRNACFCDEAISSLGAIFKERVKDYIENDNFLSQIPSENLKYFDASSRLLSCNIVAISFPFQNPVTIHFFPLCYDQNPLTIYPRNIVLFGEIILSNRSLQRKFSFCIPKEVGMQKQRQALAEILNRTTIPQEKEKMKQKISRLPDVSDNFIMSLLKNDFGQIIPYIYKSSYVLSKLADAGFETDPRTRDSTGQTALFHALKTGESHLVSLLYDHAANACLQTDASVRSPDPVIVENLLCLKEHLKLLEKDLESDETSEKSWSLFRDLCKFNEFQIEICRSINNIRLRINYYDQTEVEYEAMQRKDTISLILKTYEIYFDYMSKETNSSTEEDDNLSRFKEFYKHKDYFDKLDFSSAVMFFDHLFHLKERLRLPNKVYLDIESNFFLFIFCRKYLERYEQNNYSYFVSRWITFQERLSLQRQMRNFREILDRTELSGDNIVDKLPEAAVRTLINLPQIYGQFLIFRLQHYLNTATELTVKDLKSILIIERCIQVMGECCKESDFNSVQRIIALALPQDFTRHLKQIRNRLAHIKPHELLYRNNLEQDVELFVGIQSELIKLKKLLLPIYAAHKYEMDQFLLLHSIKSVCKARKRSILEKHENQLRAILPSPEMEENQISMPTDSCQSSWKRYFDNMHTSLKNEINELNRNGNILDKSITSRYKLIIQNIISAIGEVLKKLKVVVPQKAIEELDSHFWCLENILTFITKDPKVAMYRRTLLSTLKARKSLFTGIRKGAHQCQKISKSPDAIPVGRPAAESGLVENRQSLRVKETCNNYQRDINPLNTFEKFGVLFDTNLGSFTFLNKNDDKDSSQKRVKGSGTNDTKIEINGGNFENSFFRNMLDDDNISENTREECKQIDDLDENTDHPQQLIITEENDLPFSETSNIVSRDDWLIADIFNNYQDYPADSDTGDPASIMDADINWKKNSKFSTFKEDAAAILSSYEVIACKMYQKIPGKKERNVEFHFGCIEKYCLILKGWTILSENEKESILRSVPKQFQNLPELKLKIISLLKGKTQVTKEMEGELNKLNLKNKEIKEIAENIKLGLTSDAEHIVDSARDYFLDLQNMLELKEFDKKECELLCKKLRIPDDVKDTLMKLVPGQNKKIPGNQFHFLRNRIKMLKNILIDDNNSIQQLWERATTPRRKMHVKEKIIQLYLNNSQTQAAVETLLFDCMTILSSKELKNLWKKTTNLFNGINLRNVLAHGHPLLESLGRLLDPYDLPSELVEKMLKLIHDECAIDCMQQILEQSGSNFSGFMQIMNDEENEQFKNLREQILECDQWKEYALLIPLGEVKCS